MQMIFKSDKWRLFCNISYLENSPAVHIDEANAKMREFLKLNFRSSELSKIRLCMGRNFLYLQ